RLDVAVNNAGTDGVPGPFVEQTPESYASIFDVNVLGVVLCMKHELRAMMPQRSGCIVNVSSVLGHRGMPNVALYVASKHAVEGLTKSAAQEAGASGVRVNVVAPGPIDTAMFDRYAGSETRKAELGMTLPIGHVGRPDEAANVIAFLASDRASF